MYVYMWIGVEGKKVLCTQISTREDRKVRHIVHLFSGMRCITTLSVMSGMMSSYILVILCSQMREAVLYHPEFVFSLP